MTYCKRQNAKRDAVDKARGPYTHEEYGRWEDSGSDAPYFRYTL